jgi:uncharacterized membrane protein
MTGRNADFDRLLGPDRRLTPPTGLAAVVSVVSGLILLGLILMWPRGDLVVDLGVVGFADDTVTARVNSVHPGPCSYAMDLPCRTADIRVTSGEHTGEAVTLEFPEEPGQPVLVAGERLFLSVVIGEDGQASFQYADRDRRILLGLLALGFAVAVVGLGRVRGVAALAALVLSVGLLLVFILPAILAGRNAVLVALVGGGAIAIVSLYLAHGYRQLTHAAALGIFGALLLTVGLSSLVVTLAGFSGLTGDDYFLIAIPELDLGGLVLAGVVLGALGALDDIAVTQASAVWEVHQANPELDRQSLYQAGIRVGRDHIVSTVNTLLLAYAGASLPLIILFSLSAQPLGVVASSEVVAVEIVRTLVGSVGLVAAVPLTTWLSARVTSGMSTE